MTVVTLIPKRGREGESFRLISESGQRYAVRLGVEVLVKSSRDPEHDAARALLARGITDRMTTVGLDGKPRMHLDIEKAAKLTVRETSKGGLSIRKWEPFPSGRGALPERVDRSGGTRVADEANARPRADNVG